MHGIGQKPEALEAQTHLQESLCILYVYIYIHRYTYDILISMLYISEKIKSVLLCSSNLQLALCSHTNPIVPKPNPDPELLIEDPVLLNHIAYSPKPCKALNPSTKPLRDPESKSKEPSQAEGWSHRSPRLEWPILPAVASWPRQADMIRNFYDPIAPAASVHARQCETR